MKKLKGTKTEQNLKEAFKINNLAVSKIGEDILIEGYVEKGGFI